MFEKCYGCPNYGGTKDDAKQGKDLCGVVVPDECAETGPEVYEWADGSWVFIDEYNELDYAWKSDDFAKVVYDPAKHQ